MVTVSVYASRNLKGHWFKSFLGGGPTWQVDLRKAKVFTRLAQARSRMSAFATRWPNEPLPELIEFDLTGAKVVETEPARVAKVIANKRLKTQRHEEAIAQREMKRAERNLAEAQEKINTLKASKASKPLYTY